MDKKYLGKTVPLPKDISDRLEQTRQKLAQQLGFVPSLSDTIGWLCKQFNDAATSEPVPAESEASNDQEQHVPVSDMPEADS